MVCGIHVYMFFYIRTHTRTAHHILTRRWLILAKRSYAMRAVSLCEGALLINEPALTVDAASVDWHWKIEMLHHECFQNVFFFKLLSWDVKNEKGFFFIKVNANHQPSTNSNASLYGASRAYRPRSNEFNVSKSHTTGSKMCVLDKHPTNTLVRNYHARLIKHIKAYHPGQSEPQLNGNSSFNGLLRSTAQPLQSKSSVGGILDCTWNNRAQNIGRTCDNYTWIVWNA